MPNIPKNIQRTIGVYEKIGFQVSSDEHFESVTYTAKGKVRSSKDVLLIGLANKKHNVGIAFRYESPKDAAKYVLRGAVIFWPGGSYPVSSVGDALVVMKIVMIAKMKHLDIRETIAGNFMAKEYAVVKSGKARDEGKIATRRTVAKVKHDRKGNPVIESGEDGSRYFHIDYTDDFDDNDEYIGTFEDLEQKEQERDTGTFDPELYQAVIEGNMGRGKFSKIYNRHLV